MATVKDVWNLLDRKAPFRTQMDFANAGFLVGRGDQQVTRVLVALDITPEVIREAGMNLLDAGHYSTEAVVCPVIAQWVREAFPDLWVEVAENQGEVFEYF